MSDEPRGNSRSDLTVAEEQIVSLIAAADQLIGELTRDLQRQPANATAQQMLNRAIENRQRLGQRLEFIRRVQQEPAR